MLLLLPPHTHAASQKGLRRASFPVYQLLLKLPVLRCCLAIGDRDEMVTLEETVEAYKAIPAGSLAVLPHTRHALEKVSVQRLGAIIRDYFDM